MDSAEIEKLADLARLEISADTMNEVATSISDILELIDQLQTADTENIEPLANPLDATQRLRPDTVTEMDQRAQFQEIAPMVESGLYLVPKVIE